MTIQTHTAIVTQVIILEIDDATPIPAPLTTQDQWVELLATVAARGLIRSDGEILGIGNAELLGIKLINVTCSVDVEDVQC